MSNEVAVNSRPDTCQAPAPLARLLARLEEAMDGVMADDIPPLWFRWAYHGYLALKELDTRVLEGRLPPAIFYNLLVSARAPAESGSASRAERYAAAAAR